MRTTTRTAARRHARRATRLLVVVFVAELAIAVLIGLITIVANGGVGPGLPPQVAYATAAHATAVCDTDADCAVWARAHGAAQVGGPLVTAEPDENDPRWDCRTMGNQLCGPQAVR